jgi:hypothetical protein
MERSLRFAEKAPRPVSIAVHLKLSATPTIRFYSVCKLVGGDKPRPYLSGSISFVGAGFNPARKGFAD